MATHAVRPAELDVKEGHGEYPCAPAATATPEFIVVLAKLFAGTMVQVVDAVDDENVPERQTLATLVPVAPFEYEPAGIGLQTLDPTEEEKVPEAHSTHVLEEEEPVVDE